MVEKKVVVVTGASRGIGLGILEHLAKRGSYIIVGTSRSESGAEHISTCCQEHAIEGVGLVCDITDQASIDDFMDRCKSQFGAPQILINNAGITEDNILLRMKQQQWDKVIDANLNGVYRMTKACLKAMFKARYGRIVTVTSLVGYVGNFGQANYAASKAGAVGFMKSLAREVAAYGITANCVAPGFIATEMAQDTIEKYSDKILAEIPMGKIGAVSDVAAACGYFISDAAGYVTGQSLHINGGMIMI